MRGNLRPGAHHLLRLGYFEDELLPEITSQIRWLHCK